MSALHFTPKKRGSVTDRLCTYEGHTGPPQSARWRVAIATRPLLDERGLQLYCCHRCKRAMIEVWDEALDADAVGMAA